MSFNFSEILNSNSNQQKVYWEEEWLYPNDIKHILSELQSHFTESLTKFANDNLKAKPVNPYLWIEQYVNQRDYDNNVKTLIKYLKKDLLPIDLAPHNIYEQAISNYFERTIFKPRKPGYQLHIAPEKPFIEVLREITDFNEDGYVSRVINRDKYISNKKYYDKKIKKNDSLLTIGDCYWGTLEPLVKEYNESGNFIGFYCECMVNPIHPNYTNTTSYLESEFSRIFGFLKPYLTKERLFSLKIVDYSPYEGTIILPQIVRERANCSVGDVLHTEIFSTYSRNDQHIKYGSASSKELIYKEYLLWNFNNNFFLKLEFNQREFTYEDIKRIKRSSKFSKIVDNYKLYDGPESFYSANKIKEQNIGVISNKILKATMAILYA